MNDTNVTKIYTKTDSIYAKQKEKIESKKEEQKAFNSIPNSFQSENNSKFEFNFVNGSNISETLEVCPFNTICIQHEDVPTIDSNWENKEFNLTPNGIEVKNYAIKSDDLEIIK